LLPTSLWDTNGNYVEIAYKDASGEIPYSPMAIDFIIYDTMGRLVEFQYDSTGNLTSIDAPGFGGTSQNPITNTLVRFDYQTLSMSYTFSGLTVERGASSQTTLKHIYYPATGTGYMPAYSQYGMGYASLCEGR
jgi:YD repeat-containing protein